MLFTSAVLALGSVWLYQASFVPELPDPPPLEQNLVRVRVGGAAHLKSCELSLVYNLSYAVAPGTPRTQDNPPEQALIAAFAKDRTSVPPTHVTLTFEGAAVWPEASGYPHITGTMNPDRTDRESALPADFVQWSAVRKDGSVGLVLVVPRVGDRYSAQLGSAATVTVSHDDKELRVLLFSDLGRDAVVVDGPRTTVVLPILSPTIDYETCAEEMVTVKLKGRPASPAWRLDAISTGGDDQRLEWDLTDAHSFGYSPEPPVASFVDRRAELQGQRNLYVSGVLVGLASSLTFFAIDRLHLPIRSRSRRRSRGRDSR